MTTIEYIKTLLLRAAPGPWTADYFTKKIQSASGVWVADTDSANAPLLAATPDIAVLFVMLAETLGAILPICEGFIAKIPAEENQQSYELELQIAHDLLRKSGLET